jgi:hypothetical protein
LRSQGVVFPGPWMCCSCSSSSSSRPNVAKPECLLDRVSSTYGNLQLPLLTSNANATTYCANAVPLPLRQHLA